jgi:hypothetical protein
MKQTLSPVQTDARPAMRDVTPRGPQTAARLREDEVTLTQFVDLQFKRLKDDAFMLIGDVSTGLHNRLSKSEVRFDRLIARLEEQVKELGRELDKRNKRRAAKLLTFKASEHPGKGNWKARKEVPRTEPETLPAGQPKKRGRPKYSGRLSRMGMKS